MDKINLPKAFAERMQRLLQNEYDTFLSAYGKERYYGLRRNPLKYRSDDFSFLTDVPAVSECNKAEGTDTTAESLMTPVPWEPEGFYYDSSLAPGKHPLHEAGAYYIQEPSAMSAVSVLDPKPGECILDLCAAPGGKSTQIAGRMQGEGLLIVNEIVPSRAQILSQNIERMGVRNAVVLNESPDRLSPHFPEFFDRILVDAPCSGEGMFRKEEIALTEWSEENVSMCADRQLTVLEDASKMLRPGGTLVYSTCTFSPAENEGCMYRFLLAHPEFSLAESNMASYFSKGCPEYVYDSSADCPEDIDKTIAETLNKTMRLWPHKLKGEGHFVALLQKSGEPDDSMCDVPDKTCKKAKSGSKTGKGPTLSAADLVSFGIKKEVAEEMLSSSKVILFGENIYLLPNRMIPLDKLKVVRPGLWIGTAKKDRIEPSHSLALTLRPFEVDRSLALSNEDVYHYIHGEAIACPGDLSGWTLLTYRGVSVAFGKASAGIMKNHYPKGLRK